jgi:hypothetical protein
VFQLQKEQTCRQGGRKMDLFCMQAARSHKRNEDEADIPVSEKQLNREKSCFKIFCHF